MGAPDGARPGRSRSSSSSFATGYYYVSFARLLDARLHGERATVFPQVFARPLELRRGQSLTEAQLVDRLNDLGYAQRTMFEKPGEFVIGSGDVTIMPRGAEFKGRSVRVVFQRPAAAPAKTPARRPARPAPPAPAADRVLALERDSRPTERLTLDAPVLTALINGEREKRRAVALAAIPSRMTQAVLAIEDRRYYQHPGIDPIGIAGALFSYATGRRAVLAGGSTITQQVIRNVFLPKFEGMTLQSARVRSIKRKLLEQFLAVVLTSRASKDEILEMYLNDVPLGQRGSFAIFGVAEASRLFFGKDVSNVSLAEAATIAGVIQSPSALSPFNNAERCKERRNVVLQAMVDAGFVDQEAADARGARAARRRRARARSRSAALRRFRGSDARRTVSGPDDHDDRSGRRVHDARSAPAALRAGRGAERADAGRHIALAPEAEGTGRGGAHRRRSEERRDSRVRRRPVVQPVAIQPGDLVAPAAGIGVQAVRVPDRVRAGRRRGAHRRHAGHRSSMDEPETFEFDDQVWTPANYQDEYEGPITFRRALAMSRNLATIHVAQTAGYDNIANLWKKMGVGDGAESVSVDRAGRVRSDAVRDRHRLHHFPEHGNDPPAQAPAEDHARRQGHHEAGHVACRIAA